MVVVAHPTGTAQFAVAGRGGDGRWLLSATRRIAHRVSCRARESVGRRVVDADEGGLCPVVLPEVPDAGVVGPDIVRIEVLARLGGAVPHRELGAARHARKVDPDERLAVGVPRVDVVGKAVAFRVDETDVDELQGIGVGGGHLGVVEIAVVEPRDRGREPHEDGEVREDFRLGVAAHGELHAARELGDGRIGFRNIRFDLRPCKRRDDKSHETKDTTDFIFHTMPFQVIGYYTKF